MRATTWLGGVAALAIALVLLSTTWGTARAEKTQDAPYASSELCDQLWEHVLGVMKAADPQAGLEISRLAPEELEDARGEFAKECLQQREATVRCMLTKSTDDEFEACIDEHDPEQRLESKRAEALVNLDAIRTAERAYHAEWDVFTSCAVTPTTIPGVDPAPFQGAGLANWERLGWIADGRIRCRYRVVAYTGAELILDNFEATAECDLDGDGHPSVYRATKLEKPHVLTPDWIK